MLTSRAYIKKYVQNIALDLLNCMKFLFFRQGARSLVCVIYLYCIISLCILLFLGTSLEAQVGCSPLRYVVLFY